MQTNRRGFFGAIAGLIGSSIYTMPALAAEVPKPPIHVEVSQEMGLTIVRITLRKDVSPIFKKDFELGLVRRGDLRSTICTPSKDDHQRYYEGEEAFFVKKSMFIDCEDRQVCLDVLSCHKNNSKLIKKYSFLNIVSYEGSKMKAFIVADRQLTHVESFI